MTKSINGGYEYSDTPYVPKGAEDSDGTTKVTTRRGVTLRNTLLAAAGGVVLAATLTACGPNGEPVETPTSTEAPSPTPTESEQTYEELVASIEIEAGLDDQTLAATFVERQSEWWNAGTDPVIRENPERDSRTIEDFGLYIAEQQKAAYIDALFVDGVADDGYIDINVATNGNTVAKYLQTVIKNEPDFEHTSTFISQTNMGSGEGSRTLRIVFSEQTNDPSYPINGETAYDVTFVVDGDTEKISSVALVR